MAPKKGKKNNKRKIKTPQRFTRANPIITDTETEVESQPDEGPDPVESEGESDQETVPTLPNGEWYMPDLNSTPLLEVIKKGAPYEGDNTGRILTQFPKLKPYTKSNFYLVSPFTGEIDLYDLDTSKCIAFPVKATRDRVANSTIITVFSERIRDWLTNIYSNLATDVALRSNLGKTTYEVPSFDPHNILIKNRGEISSLCRTVNDIAEGIMDKASTMAAISTSLQQPVINIVEDASTPTNAGMTASAARRVAFSDEPQDITDRLVQLSTTSTTDPLGRTGRPSINPEGPWQQQCPSPNSVSSFNSNGPVHCYKLCGIVGHYSNQCSRKAWCDNCKRDNHATAFCLTKNKPVTNCLTKKSHRPAYTTVQCRALMTSYLQR